MDTEISEGECFDQDCYARPILRQEKPLGLSWASALVEAIGIQNLLR